MNLYASVIYAGIVLNQGKGNLNLNGWMGFSACAMNVMSMFFLTFQPDPLLHGYIKKYPSIDIVNEDGIRQKPVTRYMEDVDDPHFREYAYRMARKLVERYHNHPALLNFGLCNELGSGYHSYSETARRELYSVN